MEGIFPLELLSFIFEINLIKKQISKIIQIVYYFVNKENCCQISRLIYFTLFIGTHFWDEIKRIQL